MEQIYKTLGSETGLCKHKYLFRLKQKLQVPTWIPFDEFLWQSLGTNFVLPEDLSQVLTVALPSSCGYPQGKNIS